MLRNSSHLYCSVPSKLLDILFSLCISFQFNRILSLWKRFPSTSLCVVGVIIGLGLFLFHVVK